MELLRNSPASRSRSPYMFSDSDEESEILDKQNRQRLEELKNGAVSSKLKAASADDRQHKPNCPVGSLSRSSNGVSKNGNKYDDFGFGNNSTLVKTEFLTPKANPSRKRVISSLSSSYGAPSRNMNKSLMDPPLVPNGNKLSKYDDSYCSDFYSDDDCGSVSGKSRVSELIGRLGSEIQQKVERKKQRLEEQFRAVRAIPSNFIRSRETHTAERQTLLQNLQAESEKIHERLENMIHLGTVQYEKQEKALEDINQGSEEVRKALENCINTQTALYEKFTEDLKTFDKQHVDATTGLTEICEHSLRDLHARLECEIIQAETETLAKIKV